MSRDRFVDQLILMSDGRYLSSTTSSVTLRLVSYNADAESLAYIQLPFQWQEAGVIVGGPPYILALPVLPYSSYAPSRSAQAATEALLTCLTGKQASMCGLLSHDQLPDSTLCRVSMPTDQLALKSRA